MLIRSNADDDVVKYAVGREFACWFWICALQLPFFPQFYVNFILVYVVDFAYQ